MLRLNILKVKMHAKYGNIWYLMIMLLLLPICSTKVSKINYITVNIFHILFIKGATVAKETTTMPSTAKKITTAATTAKETTTMPTTAKETTTMPTTAGRTTTAATTVRGTTILSTTTEQTTTVAIAGTMIYSLFFYNIIQVVKKVTPNHFTVRH